MFHFGNRSVEDENKTTGQVAYDHATQQNLQNYLQIFKKCISLHKKSLFGRDQSSNLILTILIMEAPTPDGYELLGSIHEKSK